MACTCIYCRPNCGTCITHLFRKNDWVFPDDSNYFITGIGGAYLAKRQGIKAWNELRRRMATMETPGNALIDSVCILLGGILLLMPGFITDIVAFYYFLMAKKYYSTIYSKMDL